MSDSECSHYTSYRIEPGQTPWIKCSNCGDFICTVHNEHVADCACPGIGVWLEHGIDPYAPLAEEQFGNLHAVLMEYSGEGCDD